MGLHFSSGDTCPLGSDRVSSAVEMFEPVTITRSTSAVPSAGGSEGFWPDAIDTDKSATPTLAPKAMPTGQRSNVSERF